MLINVAVSLELRDRFTPSGWVGIATTNVAWDTAGREEPDVDDIAGPLCGEYTAAVGVETITIRSGAGVLNVAALVAGLAGRIDIAIR